LFFLNEFSDELNPEADDPEGKKEEDESSSYRDYNEKRLIRVISVLRIFH